VCRRRGVHLTALCLGPGANSTPGGSCDRVPEQLNVSFHWHILATESKRWPRYEVHVEGKRWTISHGFAVTIKSAMTMANAVLTT
jgi:hypothetical protein